MSEWISVEDRLPDPKIPVLMVAVRVGRLKNYTTDQYAGWFNRSNNWARWPHIDFFPTHWQPLPPPPGAPE